MTTALPLLDVRDLTVEFSTRRGIVQAVRHVDISVAKGETLAIVGEFRVRKIRHVVRGDADSRPRRAHRRRFDRFHRPRHLRRQRNRDAQPARPRNVDDLPEPARRAQSDPQGRHANRGRADPARAGRIAGRHRQGDRAARAGAHRAAARALPCLSVRTLRRHVPAHRDRARARLPASAPDRRRADHRPRRDHPEDRDGACGRADQAAWHVHHPDHPRPRAGGDLLRPGDRDGEGQGRRDRDRPGDLHGPRASLYPQADAGDAAARRVIARPAA